MDKHEIIARLSELLKSPMGDVEQAEYDRLESQLIDMIGDFAFGCFLDRLLADLVNS